MSNGSNNPVALVTGAARRIGAQIARTLHKAGFNVIIHYHHSSKEAENLCHALNTNRAGSCITLKADLLDQQQLSQLAKQAHQAFDRIDLLINNASSFYPTPLANITELQWDDLIGSNLKAPYFLSVMVADALTKARGTIINIADIYGEKPLANHSIYSIAKAGNRMMTRALAKELAPHVRVNGIAPGAILWPEDAAELSAAQKTTILQQVPLNRCGEPQDIANAALFLATSASYITGNILTVDGGRNATS